MHNENETVKGRRQEQVCIIENETVKGRRQEQVCIIVRNRVELLGMKQLKGGCRNRFA